MENSFDAAKLYQVTEVELIYKSKVKASERPKITRSCEVYEVFKSCWDLNKIELQEQFKVMFLNRANKVLCIYEVGTGGITGTVADLRLIFAAALKANACCVVLSHNHPSGNLQPSKADLDLTSKIKAAGDILDIKVIDHLIVCMEGYLSFADEGFL
jgi:DNA repair protein RadC